MSDTEVLRLRRLRNTALWARAIAAVLDSRQTRRNSVFFRTQLSCWRVARTVTGKLRAHPHPRYQREPGGLHAACTRGGASFLGAVAQRRGRSLQILALELQRVARELDDARALTRSADLSDDFGRSQIQIRSLIKELDCAARNEARQEVQAQHEIAPQTVASVESENWPYLAL
jgi:hypothetical protein